MKELLGEEIAELWVSKGEHYLKVISFADTTRYGHPLGGGERIYGAYGDCCSVSWFADITGMGDIIGEEIISVSTLALPQHQDGRTRWISDRLYGYRLTTIKGEAEIIFRCSSNGYYGGWVTLISGWGTHPEDAYLAKHVGNVEWVPIVKDWQAGEQ